MSTILRVKRSPGNKGLGKMSFSGLLENPKMMPPKGNFTCETAFHITPTSSPAWFVLSKYWAGMKSTGSFRLIINAEIMLTSCTKLQTKYKVYWGEQILLVVSVPLWLWTVSKWVVVPVVTSVWGTKSGQGELLRTNMMEWLGCCNNTRGMPLQINPWPWKHTVWLVDQPTQLSFYFGGKWGGWSTLHKLLKHMIYI